MRVLVVDDSSTMRRIVRNNLKAIGYTDIVEAEHGQAALGQLAQGGVDLVITDWNMPVMTGIDLVVQMRSQPALQQLPVLMVTTMAEKANIIQAIQAGVTNYVVKPFDTPTLQAKIAQVLSKK